jgi:RimJ/RimL family protein N-acetyltransferase
MPFLAWSLFHGLGVFRTRDYALLLIHRDGRLVHRTCLLPAHFRFPFMAPGDLQAAGIWTDPGQRGQGLATLAMAHLLAHLGGPARTLWYLTRLDNLESIHLAEKCGYLLAGRVVRQPRWGSRLLATFRLETTGEP